MPEQQRANNANNCFNWFSAGDIERGRGEAMSIRCMVEKMIVDHGIDRRRVFVTGLSAGGAMTSVMLATYPDVFAAGAIIAGLPYGTATNVKEAFESMGQVRARSARLLHYGRELSAMDQVIGIMLVIVAIGIVADKVLFSPWERFMHRRWGTGLK